MHGAHAVLATTTSSLSIAELANASGHPENFVGFHLFNPVPKMKLVELAFPSEGTSETRRRARELCKAIGKTPIEVPEHPRFRGQPPPLSLPVRRRRAHVGDRRGARGH